MTAQGKITILGINGHIGHHAAAAFAATGWDVTGFGRSNRMPISGVKFLAGDADNLADLQKAVEGADVVVNALNLPYHQWDQGRMEAQTARVIEAVGTTGKTLMYPGNIYNFAATDRVITPSTPQHPETPRGAIRVRSEALLKAAADRGDLQLIIVRAGDFFAAGNKGDYFEQGIMRQARKNKIAYPGPLDAGHSWAYLPDLGRAFEKLAWHRKDLGRNETFHFAGHYVTGSQLIAAIKTAAPVPLSLSSFPWPLFYAVGLFTPLLREIIKMRYLWNNPMQLSDPRLGAILGPDFGTPFQKAIDAVVGPYFENVKVAA